MKPLRLLRSCLAAVLWTSTAFCIATSSAARAADLPPALNGAHNLATLGDSITQGGGGPGGYVWLMQKYLDTLYPDAHIQVLNAGISGHKSNDMLARFQRDVVDRKADLVTISVGINDVWHGFDKDHPMGGGPGGVTVEDFRKNLEAMLDMARKANMKVVLFTPTIFEDYPDSPRNRVLRDYTAVIRDLAQQNHLSLADQNAAFMGIWEGMPEDKRTRLTGDQVHMAPLGNWIMARIALVGIGVPVADLDAAGPKVREAVTAATTPPGK